VKIILRVPGAGARRILVQLLFYFAAACLLASLGGAPGQLYLGKLYYIKDAGVVLCFFILAALAAVRNDKMAMLLAAAAVALSFIFAAALPKDETAATGLTIMWIIKWTVVVQLGVLTYVERLYRDLAIAVSVLLAIVCADALIGLWEIRTQGYFFDLAALDTTAAGTVGVTQEHVGDLIRVLGIHRNGGDFGNTMGIGMIIGTFLALTSRRKVVRLVLTPLLLLCAYDIFFSTVRSFLVGSVAGVLALLGAILLRRLLGRHLVNITFALIGACLFFSYFNIIPVVEFVSKHFLNDVAIGDVTSSYMRLDAWDDVYANIRAAPIVTVIGGPLAAALSVNTPASNICDNVYLWVFYHLGIFGLAGFVVCMPLPLATRTDLRVRTLYFAMASQLLVTGIFTDSLFQFSSLILCFTLGLILAEWQARPAPKVQYESALAQVS
jgi:hypothetical protein